MAKITFMGAGSTVFAINVIGDCMLRDSLKDAHVALYDIDAQRLQESEFILKTLNKNINQSRMTITPYLGVENRQKALAGADFVINAIQVGGYKPSTVIDFEIPAKFGLKQTIGDTLGIGGIFRGLRTIPVMMDFAHDIEKVAPEAWLLNYTNPMSILTGAVLRGSGVKTVGLCHSVQVVVESLVEALELKAEFPAERIAKLKTKVAGINHMAWLLEISEDGKDLYPEFKKLATQKLKIWRKAEKDKKSGNMIRLEIMNKFGYYITESSEHNAEYTPYWIKHRYPELISEYNIPINEYLTRCINQIAKWGKTYAELSAKPDITHELSHEYGSGIINSIITNTPYQIGGNVLNNGFIPNLPANSVVEVPCLVNRNGIQGCYVGNLPPQCAALNMTNINTHLLTIEAALTRKKEHIYHAALLDPHTSSELSIDDTIKMCDELIKAHGNMLPKYK